MLSRARDKSDLFRLLASGQLDVALVAEPDASAAATGSRVVSNGGPLPLRALAQLGPYLLVCRAEFPAANAYQIAEALAERWPELADPATGALAGPRPAGSPRVALHPGARAYYEDHPARPAVR